MKRQRQRGGAIVILVSQVSVALAILAIFTLYVGRWLNQQEESGNQADALSLAAMEIARNEGISNIRQLCAHPAMQRLLHDLNGNRTAQFRGDCGRFVEIRNPDGTITLHFQVNTQSELEVGPLAERYVRGQVFPLQATAKAAITQENFDEAERRRYKLVLVLDFSGSMNEPFSGSSRISALRQAVNGLLDRNFEIDYGMVSFSSNVITSVAIGPNSTQRIRDEIRRGAGGGTNYGDALNATQGLFNAVDDFGENVLFISDGAPNPGTPDPLPIVMRMWDRASPPSPSTSVGSRSPPTR
jgi:Mg-chelatase subunit ChlD